MSRLRILLFPVPYVLTPILILLILFVAPFNGTMRTYYEARSAGYDVSGRSLIGWIISDTGSRFVSLARQLRQWPGIWKRSL